MTAQPNQSYQVNNRTVSADEFIAIACNPAHSVVVQACAGSGKTWLLVARMLRLLLAGAQPAELLAITFTRKAAQEMRERLLDLLKQLALEEEPKVRQLLIERGIADADLAVQLPKARALYEQVLATSQPLALDTFHSWFGRLIQIAPLNSGVPHGVTLTEATAQLRSEAYRQLMHSLAYEKNAAQKQAISFLYQELGMSNATNLLEAFLDKRAEWWACNDEPDQGQPIDWLSELCGPDAHTDARLSLWEDVATLERIQQIARWLGQGTMVNQKRATAIETAISNGASSDNFAALCFEFFSTDDKNRSNTKTKALLAALEKQLGADCAAAFDDECSLIADMLRVYQQRSCEPAVLQINAALFTVGVAYVDNYQALKSEQRVVDFTDLEWQAYQLLKSGQHAAYVQSRLDARYKHILLDEFQDTNPLQWSIVRAWLDAYGAEADRPSVFVVGDPKQSIYRFRRADPRVFNAAANMLTQQGAYSLQTNQTRRNAPQIVEVLNLCMASNPLFTEQATLAVAPGAVWRLPLVSATDTQTADDNAPVVTPGLRNPLTTPLQEAEDERRLEEGRQIASALLLARTLAQEPGTAAPTPWNQMMLLVRRRTHLSAYETALREAGIPFVSSRRGGLLDALEVADLIALLKFLITPSNNLALAHVLKSPMIAATDSDLIALAQRAESSWWKRLLASEITNPVLQRATRLLSLWMEAAHELPVHDLLDRIMHQGELVQRYAQYAPFASRGQVIGNLSAFIELALNMDAGRYPSLPKFINALMEFQSHGAADAPDESNVENSADAVRILTIHSAKGLEARVVVIVDANHSDGAQDTQGILCEWPLEPQEQQKHFSAYGRKSQRGMARNSLFQLEQQLATQENWNLLYVAMTRAKAYLIISGVAGPKRPVVAGSWYERLQSIPEYDLTADSLATASMNASMSASEFELSSFIAPDLAVPTAAVSVAAAMTEAQNEGVALHSLLERMTSAQVWPIKMPEAPGIASWLGCSLAVAQTVSHQAQVILQTPELQRFFNPELFQFARNEMEIFSEGRVLRLDRVVVFEDEVWILDFKRQLLASEQADYEAQLQQYQVALGKIYQQKKIMTRLIVGRVGL